MIRHDEQFALKIYGLSYYILCHYFYQMLLLTKVFFM